LSRRRQDEPQTGRGGDGQEGGDRTRGRLSRRRRDRMSLTQDEVEVVKKEETGRASDRTRGRWSRMRRMRGDGEEA
jgi:hypothetical protein